MDTPNFTRPYLVIPKLIEQPTWGGHYIVDSKGWANRPAGPSRTADGTSAAASTAADSTTLADIRIGQSYELFSGSNLSLAASSDDPTFTGELTDRDAVASATGGAGATALATLIAADPEAALGAEILAQRGPHLDLLLKYTQALGNSFQTHIRSDRPDPTGRWKPKPESWYYFEPGLVTLGAKPDVNWDAYRAAVEAIAAAAEALGDKVAGGALSHTEAVTQLARVVQAHDPWQFVNTIPVQPGQLVDLSSGGLHHSWEEDPLQAPLGNVLYEIQYEALDAVSTFRSFDKGKIEPDGRVRALQIPKYFDAIDRSPEVNDPAAHIVTPVVQTQTDVYKLERLLVAPRFYNLDRLTLTDPSAAYSETISRFKHLFVKSGRVSIEAGGVRIIVGAAHSGLIPAAAARYTVTNLADTSEILISY